MTIPDRILNIIEYTGSYIQISRNRILNVEVLFTVQREKILATTIKTF